MKSLLVEQSESRRVGSKGHEAELQDRQVVSGGLEEEQTQQTEIVGVEVVILGGAPESECSDRLTAGCCSWVG